MKERKDQAGKVEACSRGRSFGAPPCPELDPRSDGDGFVLLPGSSGQGWLFRRRFLRTKLTRSSGGKTPILW